MDGLFPTGALAVNATTRDITAAFRRVPIEALTSAVRGVSEALALGRAAPAALETPGVDASAVALIGASISDAVRSRLPESAVREWWESAGLDGERASAVARAISAAVPSITAQFEREGICLPQLVDVKWQLDYAVSSQAVGRVGDAVLRVDVVLRTPSTGALRNHTFSCSPQELEELLRTLKAASAAAQRAAK